MAGPEFMADPRIGASTAGYESGEAPYAIPITEDTDLATGIWADGRIGTFRGHRTGPHTYGATVFGSNLARIFPSISSAIS